MVPGIVVRRFPVGFVRHDVGICAEMSSSQIMLYTAHASNVMFKYSSNGGNKI